jgi:hypothetical protein
MFCSDVFLDVLKKNFIEPTSLNACYHYPTHSTNKDDICITGSHDADAGPYVCAYEEPLFLELLESYENKIHQAAVFNNHNIEPRGFNRPLKFLINSEHSQLKNNWIKTNQYIDWYLFYHGFASLFWYRRFQYLPKSKTKFTHVFINYNHLILQKRSYRLNFLAKILANNLDNYGLISMASLKKHWKKEIFDPNSLLSNNSKKIILEQVKKTNKDFVLDCHDVHGALSADVNLEFNNQAFFQIVSETVFYDSKLHLTEKIFKPIVCRQPFILLGAPFNLKYLKSYGFQTFDRWIDESYDEEIDPDIRIQKVVLEIEKLTKLSLSQLYDMHNQMQAILDYNFYHFYSDFKVKIVEEMIDNFDKAINIFNYDASDRFKINYNQNLHEIKRIFLL